jgi:hypothetical protein
VKARGDDYPSSWDPRVADLVGFVERARGHDFRHPVPVSFLTDEEYGARTRTDSATLTDEDRESIAQDEAIFRALGLIDADVDLFEAQNDLTDAGTLAFYDPAEEEIVVRGNELTPDLRVTLVHELTHTLQDQTFPIEEARAKEVTSGQSFAHTALLEGDAIRIETRYYESLTAEEQQAVDAANAGGLEDLDAEGIPGPLQALFGAPYAFGDGLLQVLDARGDDAIDDAFRDLPSTEEAVLDPFSYLDDQETVDVEAPVLEESDEVFDGGDFGAASLYVVLSERIDRRQALAAAIGWGGDSYSSFDRDGRVCVRIHVTGDTPADTDELQQALAAWVAVQPGGAATSSRVDDLVELEACDPGDAAVPTTGASLDALALPDIRAQVAAGAIGAGQDEAAARCFGDTVIAEFTDEELQAAELTPELELHLADVQQRCFAGG